MHAAVSLLDALQVAIAALAFGLLPAGLWVALGAAAKTLRDIPRPERAVTFAAVAFGALVRALVPGRIVTVFLGYLATQEALDLVPLPRYGAGATVVHAAWLAIFGADHRVIIAGNAVVGALALPLWAAVFRRGVTSPWVAAVAAWILAASPMFVRNDASESNNVVALACVAVALLADDEAAPTWRRALRVLPAATLAATARPDFVVVVPLAFALRRQAIPEPKLWGALLLPHVVHALVAAAAMRDRGSLPGPARAVLSLLTLVPACALASPSAFPPALVALAAWAATRGPAAQRAEARRGWVFALLAMAPTCVDLDPANRARVHAPAAMLLAPVMAAGLVAALRGRGRVVRSLILAAVIISAAPSAWVLFRPINDDHEEAFIREALARLPPGPFTLLRLRYDDRYPDFDRGLFVHYEFPDYLFARRGGVVAGVGAFLRAPDLRAPVFFFHGMRCHARGREHGTPPPPGLQLHPACAAMHHDFELSPLVTREVPNEGDLSFPWYPTAPRLRLGLYRVLRPVATLTSTTTAR